MKYSRASLQSVLRGARQEPGGERGVFQQVGIGTPDMF